MTQPLLVGQAVKLDVLGTSPPQSAMGVLVATPPPRFVISFERHVLPPPALVPGAQVAISFTTDEIFAKARSVVSRVNLGRTATVELESFQDVQTSQRRKFFRVPASLLTLLVVSSQRASELGKEDGRALTQDVSAGGMRVDTVLPLATGDRVRVTVETPRGLLKSLPEKMIGETLVVHVAEVERRRRKLYSAGLQLVFANDREQERWLKLTFDLQRGMQIWK